MIAIDTSRGILYGKVGPSEVWIWWYQPPSGAASEFVLTTRRDTGKVETTWLGGTIWNEALSQEFMQADTDASPEDGAHGVGSYEDGSVFAWNRKAGFAFTVRLFDTPELFMAWKLYDLAAGKMKTGILGWAY